MYLHVKGSFLLYVTVVYYSHESVFKTPCNQTEGNGIFRAWAHTIVTGISIVYVLKSHTGSLQVGAMILPHPGHNPVVSDHLPAFVHHPSLLQGIQHCQNPAKV